MLLAAFTEEIFAWFVKFECCGRSCHDCVTLMGRDGFFYVCTLSQDELDYCVDVESCCFQYIQDGPKVGDKF